MNDTHISDLRWDRLLAGDLSGEQAEVAHTHAAACTACGDRLRELTAERDAFAERPLPHAKPRQRWEWRVAIATIAAAAVVTLVLTRQDATPGERSKGSGPTLLLSAGRPGALRALASGDTVHPGDYLQAGYSTTGAGFGAVLSLDGAGAATAYVPFDGNETVALPSGEDQSFPESTVLDGVIGAERVVILWCEATRGLRPLLDELRATRQIAAPPGCSSRLVTLVKQAEPR